MQGPRAHQQSEHGGSCCTTDSWQSTTAHTCFNHLTIQPRLMALPVSHITSTISATDASGPTNLGSFPGVREVRRLRGGAVRGVAIELPAALDATEAIAALLAVQDVQDVEREGIVTVQIAAAPKGEFDVCWRVGATAGYVGTRPGMQQPGEVDGIEHHAAKTKKSSTMQIEQLAVTREVTRALLKSLPATPALTPSCCSWCAAGRASRPAAHGPGLHGPRRPEGAGHSQQGHVCRRCHYRHWRGQQPPRPAACWGQGLHE